MNKRLLTDGGNIIYMLSLCIWMLQSCRSDHTEVAPTNVHLTTEISIDGSGYVKFIATADNAAYYYISFGDVSGATPFKSISGVADHIYNNSGNYEVVVTANTNEQVFTSFSTSISVSLNVPIPSGGYTSASSYPGMTLTKAEEFSTSSIDPSNWTFENGDGCPNCGWGNNELEYYTSQNAFIQEGYLIIKAKVENRGGKSYTSSRMITKDKFAFTYGRVDVRAIIPKGQGLWPAIWMLGSNINTVGWPACGEIDIMEMIGGNGREKTVYGTAHWNDGGYKSSGGSKTLSQGLFSDAFHVYSIEWTDSNINWLIDDVSYYSVPITTYNAAFKKDFFFILNVAVGGNWPGSPDGTAKFPQIMIVDYIRVFQK